MTSSLAAASTMPSSSRSETNGPSLMPLPGRIQLAKPISACVSRRSGQNLTSHSVGRAVALAACSLCRTAHVLGIASVNTKRIPTLSTKPMTSPQVPNSRSRRIVLRNAEAVCRMLTVSSTGLRNFSGSSTSRSRARPRLGSSWAMASALCRLIRLIPVSATASRASSTSRTMIVASRSASLPVNVTATISGGLRRRRGAGGSRPAPVRPSGGARAARARAAA